MCVCPNKMVFGTVTECGNADKRGPRSRCGHLDLRESWASRAGQCSARGLEGAAGPLPARGTPQAAAEGDGGGGGRDGRGAGRRLGVPRGTYLNLPWQCWHRSPTQPGSQRQVALTQRPEKQEPVLSHGLDWDTCA